MNLSSIIIMVLIILIGCVNSSKKINNDSSSKEEVLKTTNLIKDNDILSKLFSYSSRYPKFSQLFAESFGNHSQVRIISLKMFVSDNPSKPRAYQQYTQERNVIIYFQQNQTLFDQMVSVAFECVNAKKKDKFIETFIGAKNGTLQREQFILNILQNEFDTVNYIKSLIDEYNFPSNELEGSYFYHRFKNSPKQFDEYLSYVDKVSPERKLLSHYGLIFDKLSKEGTQWFINSNSKVIK